MVHIETGPNSGKRMSALEIFDFKDIFDHTDPKGGRYGPEIIISNKLESIPIHRVYYTFSTPTETGAINMLR